MDAIGFSRCLLVALRGVMGMALACRHGCHRDHGCGRDYARRNEISNGRPRGRLASTGQPGRGRGGLRSFAGG